MGAYAAAFVGAMQWGPGGAPESTAGAVIRAANTCKHFAAYSLELWNGTIRYDFDAIVSLQDLYATYLPAFQSCVQEAKVSSLMCSYNMINGTASCANGDLMNEIARGVWGFDGAVTSDCGAARAIWQTDGDVPNAEAVCGAALDAGMDYACNNDLLPLQCAAKAIADGSLAEEAVELAARRTLSVRLRTGQFDASTPFDELDNNTLVCSDASLARAQRAAEQSVTLLKVDRMRLPLDRSNVRSVAAVGPNANLSFGLLGDYSAWPCHGQVPSVAQALEAVNLSVTFAFGCAMNSTDASGIPAAAAAAAAADATVVVAGLDLSVEREGKDRNEIGWPGLQASLIAQACAASRGPCVVVLIGAGPVDVSAQLADANVAAILAVAYPGIRGAAAVVAALFGDVVPAGRLTKTIYPASYVNEGKLFCFQRPRHYCTRPPLTPPATTPSPFPHIQRQSPCSNFPWPQSRRRGPAALAAWARARRLAAPFASFRRRAPSCPLDGGLATPPLLTPSSPRRAAQQHPLSRSPRRLPSSPRTYTPSLAHPLHRATRRPSFSPSTSLWRTLARGTPRMLCSGSSALLALAPAAFRSSFSSSSRAWPLWPAVQQLYS